jgi:hypothetical protein
MTRLINLVELFDARMKMAALIGIAAAKILQRASHSSAQLKDCRWTHVTAGKDASFDGVLRLQVHISQSSQSLWV